MSSMSPEPAGLRSEQSANAMRDELLQAVSQAADEYFHAAEADRSAARERYIRALTRFNDFVLQSRNDQP